MKFFQDPEAPGVTRVFSDDDKWFLNLLLRPEGYWNPVRWASLNEYISSEVIDKHTIPIEEVSEDILHTIATIPFRQSVEDFERILE